MPGDDAQDSYRTRMEVAGGWEAIPNALLDREHPLHPSSSGEPACRAFAFVDLMGRLRERAGAGLEPGETRASTRFLAERWRWSQSRVQRFLAELEGAGVIERERDAPNRPARIGVLDRTASPMGQGRGSGSGPEPPGVSEDRESGERVTLGVGHEPGHEPGQGRGSGSGPEPPGTSEDRESGERVTERVTERVEDGREGDGDPPARTRDSAPSLRSVAPSRASRTREARGKHSPEGEGEGTSGGDGTSADGWRCPGCGERVPRTERVAHLRECADADALRRSPSGRPGLPDPGEVVQVGSTYPHTPRRPHPESADVRRDAPPDSAPPRAS